MDGSDSCANLNAFYHQVDSVVAEWNDQRITPTEKSIALLRVAFESGMDDLGSTGILHLVSRMMTTTLEILDENKEVTPMDVLRDFEINSKQPN